MKTLVSGSGGLIGSALSAALSAAGHEVWSLSRSAGERTVVWDPAAERIDTAALEELGVEAVVHLAGESITGRWTEEKKRRIRRSRVLGTGLLARACAGLERPPRSLICASAIGYYGDRGDRLLDEDDPPGDGFLAGVCVDWEAAADPAREAGIRVAHLRFGMVLSDDGGALPQMATPFRFGLGGVVGSGEQWVSWIARDDVVGIVRHVLDHDDLAGAFNTVSPRPVRNRELTAALGAVLHRPTILPLPAFAAKVAFGEMAEELLLASARVDASRVAGAGYDFRWPELEPLLRHLLA